MSCIVCGVLSWVWGDNDEKSKREKENQNAVRGHTRAHIAASISKYHQASRCKEGVKAFIVDV